MGLQIPERDMWNIALESLKVSLGEFLLSNLLWINSEQQFDYQQGASDLGASLALIPRGDLLDVSNLNKYINSESAIERLILADVAWFIGGILLLIGLCWLRNRLRKAKQAAKKSAEALEKLIEERTAQLERANNQLQREILQRQRSQQALRESEERFRTQYKEIPIPTYTWQQVGKEFVLVGYNNAAEEFSQKQIAEYLGKTATEMFSDEPKIVEEISRCYTDKTSIKREISHRLLATGEKKHLTVSYTFVLPNLVMVHLEDMTERHRAEAELKLRIHQQSVVASLGQRGLAGTDLSTLIDEAVTLVAQTLEVEYCKVLEVLPNGSTFFLRAGIGWKEGLVGSATVGMHANSQAGYTLLSGKPVIVEDLRVETRFGGSRLLHNHKVISGVSVIIPGRDQPFGVLSAHTSSQRTFTEDDTHFLQAIANVLATAIERKQAEAQLHLLERAINASSNGIVITDALQSDNPIIYVNPSCERLTGYRFEEVVGRNCRFLQGTDREQPGLNELRTALEEGRECYSVLRNYRKDGTLFWNELHIDPVHNAEGYLTNFIGVQTDITERKLVEEALRDSEERFRAIAEATPIPLLISRVSDGIILYANAHVGSTFGLPYKELIGRQTPDFYYDAADRQLLLEAIATEGCLHAYEILLKKGDGTPFWVAISLRLLKFNGEPALLSTFYDLTERRRAEEALRKSEERFRNLVETSSDFVWEIDEYAVYTYASPTVRGLLGYKPEEVLGNTPFDFMLVEEADRVAKIFAAQQPFKCLENTNIHKDSHLVILETSGVPFFDSKGLFRGYRGIDRDITERKQALEALRKSEEQFRLIFNFAPIGIALSTLDGQFLRVNQALCDAVGYTENDLLNRTFVDITHPDDLAADLLLNQKLLKGEISHFQMEKRYLAKDGRAVDTILQVALVRDSQKKPVHTIGQIVDITERKRMEKQLLHDAFHDALTGLPNRALFQVRLGQTLQRAKQDKNYLFAVLFLDLDRFKVINDSVGHLVGDKLLIAIARKLEMCLRSTDTVARLGGDEFTILLDDLTDLKEATHVAEQIHRELMLPFNLDGYEVFTSTSIGIATSDLDYDRPEDLLRDADLAMYRAKELGKARHEVFDKAMHARALVRLQLETDLRGALRSQEFLVFYQPIASLETGKLTGFEALVRWQHPTRDLVSPAEFIPLAEETGLIVPMGAWILREACAKMHTWQSQYPSTVPLTISVNLSGKQLKEPDLIEQIDRILSETGLDGRSLKLEITESVIMENAEAATTMFLQLRARNIQLSIDDFGTGYSSLSYLHRFPVNTLKVDRSFVSRMRSDDENLEIVRAIVTLAHTLKMDVIAEGVETGEQLTQLKLLGCEQGQGYFFSKPLDSSAAEALIALSPKW